MPEAWLFGLASLAPAIGMGFFNVNLVSIAVTLTSFALSIRSRGWEMLRHSAELRNVLVCLERNYLLVSPDTKISLNPSDPGGKAIENAS